MPSDAQQSESIETTTEASLYVPGEFSIATSRFSSNILVYQTQLSFIVLKANLAFK